MCVCAWAFASSFFCFFVVARFPDLKQRICCLQLGHTVHHSRLCFHLLVSAIFVLNTHTHTHADKQICSLSLAVTRSLSVCHRACVVTSANISSVLCSHFYFVISPSICLSFIARSCMSLSLFIPSAQFSFFFFLFLCFLPLSAILSSCRPLQNLSSIDHQILH